MLKPESDKQRLLITCKLIDFVEARVDEVSHDFNSFLVVSGVKPYANMKVELIPRCYIQQPEYWAIEVVGILGKIALPTVVPFEVILPLDWKIGTKGIRIVGANQSMQIDFQYIEKTNPDDGGKVIILGPRHPK